jgi:photosystem II stability/assembly factor-like uncharacterized protein
MSVKFSPTVMVCCLLFCLSGKEPAVCQATTSVRNFGSWEVLPLRSEAEKRAGLVGGEGLQMVNALKYAPSDPEIIYLGTDTSQVWRSSDGGRTWRPARGGFTADGARSLAVDPRNSAIVFAAGFLGAPPEVARKFPVKVQGIFRSTNGGSTWSLVKVAEFRRQPELGDLLCFDRSTSAAGKTPGIFAATHDQGLLYSPDGGDSWVPAGFASSLIYDLQAIPARPGEILVATGAGLFAYSFGSIQQRGAGLPGFPRTIAVGSEDPTVVYAALGKDGIYKSRDGGKSFVPAMPRSLFVKPDFVSVATSPVDARIVYAKANQSSLRSPLYSHDGGEVWFSSAPLEETTAFLSSKREFWFSAPFSPHPADPLRVITAANGGGRILASGDGGQKWQYSGAGFTGGRMMDMAFPAPGEIGLFLTDFGVWHSDNAGDTFRDLNVKRISGLSSSSRGAMRKKTIVASIGGWDRQVLTTSRDGGESWSVFDHAAGVFPLVAFHPTNDEVVYAGDFLSEDGGRTWRQLEHAVWAVDDGDGDRIFSVAEDRQGRCRVLTSKDRGRTWTHLSDCPFPKKSVQQVAFSSQGGQQLLFATANGLWLFSDGIWTKKGAKNGLVADRYGLNYVSSLAIDKTQPSRIYVGRRSPGYGQSNGVFRSCDGGASWQNVTAELGPELTVWAVKISPYNGDVYIGTSLGTFRQHLTAGEDCLEERPAGIVGASRQTGPGARR